MITQQEMSLILDEWKRIQKEEWEDYLISPDGIFSIDGKQGAEMIGEIINKTIPEKDCLDIGCGVLEKPYYMQIACDVNWMGIDPYEGDKEREFPFFKGFAENLPFSDEEFDGVLFATSLDHVLNPYLALYEAHRVLKKEGYLFIWNSLRKNDEVFQNWLKLRKGNLYDKTHLWAYTFEILMFLLKDFEIIDYQLPKGRGIIITARK